MVLYRTHAEPVLRDYYSTVCSRATLFLLAISLLALVPPALIAYATENFWRAVSSYSEQPDTRYLNQCIVLLGREGGGAGAWSSLSNYVPPPEAEALAEPVNITVSEEDTDSDGKSEIFIFKLYFSPSLDVSSVQLLLIFSVRLTSHSSVDMHSAAYVFHSAPSTTPSGLWVGGDLIINQRKPLPASGRSQSYNQLLNTSSQSWEDYELSSIISQYSQRELTAVLRPVYALWQYNSSAEGFQLQAEIHYPQQNLLYRPSFWERVKWAWVQYLAIFLVFWWALSHVKSFVFQNHIVPSIKPYSH